MMEHLSNQEGQIEEIINSLNDVSRAEAPPFFYNCLQARLQKELGMSPFQYFIELFVQPAFAITTLLLFVMLNTVAITSMLKVKTAVSVNNVGSDGSLQSFASEYDLSVSTLYSDTKNN